MHNRSSQVQGAKAKRSSGMDPPECLGTRLTTRESKDIDLMGYGRTQ